MLYRVEGRINYDIPVFIDANPRKPELSKLFVYLEIDEKLGEGKNALKCIARG